MGAEDENSSVGAVEEDECDSAMAEAETSPIETGEVVSSGTGFAMEEIMCKVGETQVLDSLVNDAQYIGRKLTTNTKVPGNIHKPEFRDFWLNEIKPTEFVKDLIVNKYKLPFSSVPPKSFEGNNKSALEDLEFVKTELTRLEKLGCIRRVQEQPYIVLPLSSVFSKKKRLVVDASRALNPYLQHRRVRLQDLRDVPEFVKEDDVFFIEDLDSGYWHVGVNEEHWQYLGVSVENDDGSPMFWVWTVLFLGVSDAVFLFTAILKPVRSYAVSKGIPCLIYLDDCCGSGRNEKEARANRAKMIEILSKCGFIVSLEKSKGPDSRIQFLGLEICSQSLKFFIPEKKISRIIDEISNILSVRKVQIRAVARVLGLLQSVGRALGNIVRLRTRYLYMWMNEKLTNASYNYFFPISEEAKEELLFWTSNINSLNGFPFSPKMSQSETTLEVVPDASAQGMFAYHLSDKYEVILRKVFSAEEAKSSSTVRELLALKNVYTSEVSNRFSGSKVVHFTDNQAVATIIDIGSRKPHLMQIALEIFFACKQKNIRLQVEWKPREHPWLQHADLGSKSFDSSSYSLDFNSFMIILEFFSEVSIDVDSMSNFWNRKCNVFYSKTEEWGCAGVNFFSQRLDSATTYYCFPPPSLIVASIWHFFRFQCHGLLVIPVWKSAAFWFNVAVDGQHLSLWAKKHLIFKPSGFVSDCQILSTTFKNPPSFEILVIKFDFQGVQEEDLFKPFLSRENCLSIDCHMCNIANV